MPFSFYMGPLSRLRLFGFVCPCHESDDEYNARVGAAALESLPIQWYRSDSRTVSLDATLHLMETKSGLFLNIQCAEYTTVSDFTNVVLRVIPLSEIDRIDLVETEYRCEIQIVARDHDLLLQFHVVSPQMVVFHLRAVLHWDQDRRAELEEKLERLQAQERLQEEQKRLFDESPNIQM